MGGYAFENVCIAHTKQIKQALGIAGVYSEQSSWRGNYENNGAQIDLIIDRKDQTINVCEFKFCNDLFVSTKKHAEVLQNKLRVFKGSTKTRKSLMLTFITVKGLTSNKFALELVQNELKLDDLFKV